MELGSLTLSIFDTQTLLVFTTVFLVTLAIWLRRQEPLNLPPGPFSLPILGTPSLMSSDVREPLKSLAYTYGDIFTIYLGSQRIVMLCSYDVIREAFVKQGYAFSGRQQDSLFAKDIAQGKGVISTEGQVWKDQRQFTLTTLRDFGMGKSILETKILQEVTPLLDVIAMNTGSTMKMRHFIQCSVANVIFSIMFGHRYKYTDSKFQKYMDIISESFELVGTAGPLVVFPFLKYIPGDPFKYGRIMEIAQYMKKEYRGEIAEHKKTIDHNQIRDFVDAYLREMENLGDKLNESTFYDEQLVAVVGDVFFAGTETTTTTLRWALAYMLHYPEVQARVQAEIEDVIGDQRLPSLQDRKNLPYTNACMLEVQRMADVVPLGVPRTTLEDVTFRGFNIPKGTTVMSNLYCVNRDERIWEDPYDFKVERFLDNGAFKTAEQMIPFSMGKRVCPGESLAKMEFFLFFTSLLQKFTFSNPEGHELPSLKGIMSTTNLAPDFEAFISVRKP